MVRILVGIATVTPDRRFLQSLPPFFRDAGKKYEIDAHWVWNKELDEAQSEIAQKTIDGKYDYLLLIEDDHWDFTVEMLDALVEANEPVAMIHYRSRHWPFKRIPMKFIGKDKNGINYYDEYAHTEGVHEADLIAFGFTLIRREVLETLDKPYFKKNTKEYCGVGPHATDIDFSNRVKDRGFRLVGVYDYVLNHRDITSETWKDFLVKGIISKNSMYQYLNKMKKNAEELNGGKS